MIRGLSIIFGCLAAGELIAGFSGIKIPPSIIGLLLLTGLLKAGWIKLHLVKGLADMLIQNFAFFFIPSGVALILYTDLLEQSLTDIVITTILSTIVVLLVTSFVHETARKWQRKHGKKTLNS